MSIGFPTSLDTLLNPADITAMNATGYEHDVQHADLNDAVEALEAKVGINGSAINTSLDYLVSNSLLKLDQTTPQPIINGPLTLGNSYGSPVAVGATGFLIAGAANVDAVAGIECKNIHAGTSADIRFAMVGTDGNYTSFAMPGLGNTVTALFGVPRATGAFLFNSNAGTPRNLVIGTIGATNIVFGTTNTARMTILSTGFVGVGTSVPGMPLQLNRNDCTTNVVWNSMYLVAVKTTDMADGFGTGLRFRIQDDAGVENTIAGVTAVREGADNSGKLAFLTFNAGAIVTGLSIDHLGNLGLGIALPTAQLHENLSDGTGIAYLITGKSKDASTDTKGIAFVLLHNATSSRQLFMGDSDNGYGVIFRSTASYAIMEGYNNVSSASANMALGGAGSVITVGYPQFGAKLRVHNGSAAGTNTAVRVLDLLGDVGQTAVLISAYIWGGTAGDKLTLTAAGNLGLGIALPTALIHENLSDGTGIALLITGKASNASTDTSGVAIVMTHNATNNRQFWFGDYTSNIGIRYVCSTTYVSTGGFNKSSLATVNMLLSPTGGYTTAGYPAFLARFTVHNLAGTPGDYAAVKVLSVVGDTGQTADMLNVHIHGATAGSLFTILASGYIGIGKAVPTVQLDITGACLISTTLGVTGVTTLGNNLVLPKTTNIGIMVDTATPTFGWRDIIGTVNDYSVGVSGPAWSTYRTNGAANVSAYKFSGASEQQIWVQFHIPHDYVPGTDIYIHTHWSQITVDTGGAAGVPGVVAWEFDVSYADGYGTAGGAADPFISPISTTVTQQGSTTQFGHMIAEVAITGASADASHIDRATIQVDGVILVRVHRDSGHAADTLNQDLFMHFVDLHYQSTNMATKAKTGPTFYT